MLILRLCWSCVYAHLAFMLILRYAHLAFFFLTTEPRTNRSDLTALERIASLMLEDEGVSTWELLQSGLVPTLLQYLSSNAPQRVGAFLDAFKPAALVELVRKLQEVRCVVCYLLFLYCACSFAPLCACIFVRFCAWLLALVSACTTCSSYMCVYMRVLLLTLCVAGFEQSGSIWSDTCIGPRRAHVVCRARCRRRTEISDTAVQVPAGARSGRNFAEGFPQWTGSDAGAAGNLPCVGAVCL